MRFALVNGSKVEPFPKGHGTCPVCGGETIAKCGTQKLWHWAHRKRQSCDPWWESETPWHRQWKSHWTICEQEVVQFNSETGEKHVADVKTAAGIVLEFQNSPMSEAERISREEFYEDMVWVVNAKRFVEHIDIGARLPNPDHPGSDDLCIRNIKSRTDNYIYHLASEVDPELTLVEIYSGRHLEDLTSRTYVGHHVFSWKRSHSVWLQAERPVFLDFGGTVLWELRRFNANSVHCLRRVKRLDFIEHFGGMGNA